MTRENPKPASRSARIGSVAVGYLGVSWIVVQIFDALDGMLGLPSWVGPGVLGLLLLGLVMVLATAWVQADPETTERERAGEVPSDWQVAPAEALAVLRRGHLPHLTWGRTIFAGVVALSLLFGIAGAWVLFTGGEGIRGRSAATVSTADGGPRIAVLPFTTTGEALAVYGEGMVELLSTNLDGLGEIRAIDSRTVLARWDERVGSGQTADLESSLRVAAATGASHALVGSMVSAGPEVRLVGQLYRLDGGEKMSEVRDQGAPDDVLTLVDRLSVAIAREILGSEDAVSETGIRLASITTASIPALEQYLGGEALYRRGRFAEAMPLLDRAIEADSTFGLAVMRRAQALGWIPSAGEDTIEAARRAIRPILGRLAPRDAVIAEGGIIDYADRDPHGVDLLRDFVRRYPDEAEGWYQLSDFLYHLNEWRGGTADEVLGGFDRAVELGPRFAPYYIHAIEGALTRADSVRFGDLVARYRALGGEPERLRQWETVGGLLFGAEEPLEMASLDPVWVVGLERTLTLSTRPQRLADIASRLRHPRATPVLLLRAGRWSEVAGLPVPDGDLWPEDASRRADLVTIARDWVGAFDMGPDAVRLISPSVSPAPGTRWWLPAPEVEGAIRAMVAARDGGAGADPLLLAHLAERAGDLDLAATLFEQESWRYLGPAATWRLARLRDRQGRSAEALEWYGRFLDSWSGADSDLPPIVEAQAAVERLRAGDGAGASGM